MEELTPTVVVPYSGHNGHTAANVLGLSLIRVHAGLYFALDQFASARDAARELLQENPKMKAREVKAIVLEKAGESISPVSISRLRHWLKGEESQMVE